MSSLPPVISSLPGAPGIASTQTGRRCPHCGESNPITNTVCQKCGVTLAPTGAIGVWGTRASGKTMYLYMLQQHINNTRAPMWQMRPDNEAAKRFLHRAV
ncbi:MAG: hypothetical protein WCF84_14055, partial [Anaerolineae bacterium]